MCELSGTVESRYAHLFQLISNFKFKNIGNHKQSFIIIYNNIKLGYLGIRNPFYNVEMIIVNVGVNKNTKMNITGNSGQRSLFAYFIILLIITIIDLLLSHFAAITWQIVPGVSGLYFAVAFMIVFALWFGVWGVIAAYIGHFIGIGMIAGQPAIVNAYWSLADFWQVLIPLVAFRTLDADPCLKTKRDFLIFLVFGVVLNNLVGAGWGASTLGGIISWKSDIFISWLISNIIVTIVIAPLLLRYITPHINKSGLYVKNYWI